MMKRDLDKNTIAIEYLQGLLLPEDIDALNCSLNDTSLSLEFKSYPPRIMAGIEELFPNIAIYLSSDLVSGIIIGVIANGVFDGIKSTFKLIYDRVKTKKLKCGNDEHHEITPNVYIKIDNLNIQVPMSAEDEEFKYFTEHVFESIKKKEYKVQTFCFYDEKTHSFIYKSIFEIGEYEYQKYQERISKERHDDSEQQ